MPRTEVTGSQIKDQSVSLTADVTGILPVANGGTGSNTLALNNVVLGNGTGAVQTVAPGTSGNVLTSNGSTWVSSALTTGTGDVTSNTATSVDSEVAVFNGTTGKQIKRATGTGLARLTSGVLSTVTAPTGAVVGTTDTQTLTGKTISGASNTLSAIPQSAVTSLTTSLDGKEPSITAGTTTQYWRGDKSWQTLNAAAVAGAEATANKNVANGYCGLDANAQVPAARLPSYVDDVLEYAAVGSFPATGETGKIYVALDTGKIHRWSGSAYVEISPSPGSTDSVTEGSVNLYYTNARADARITEWLDDTATLTNKRVNPRINSVASSATPAINVDTTDQFNITALATAITSMTSGLTGTPVDGQKLTIRIKDNGVARTIAWGSSFVASGVAPLLASTIINRTHLCGFIYDSVAAKWACVALDATGY